jgi:hypothetical protein
MAITRSLLPQLSQEELLVTLIEKSSEARWTLTNSDAVGHQALLSDMEGIVQKLNDGKSVKDSADIRRLASVSGNMQIIVSVSTRKSGELTDEFPWPADVPLIIPREGEFADFFGKEPRLVRRVTYTFNLVRDASSELVRLTIHIQTV